jgi:hypothetical protein
MYSKEVFMKEKGRQLRAVHGELSRLRGGASLWRRSAGLGRSEG